jgi:hypothetical protein
MTRCTPVSETAVSIILPLTNHTFDIYFNYIFKTHLVSAEEILHSNQFIDSSTYRSCCSQCCFHNETSPCVFSKQHKYVFLLLVMLFQKLKRNLHINKILNSLFVLHYPTVFHFDNSQLFPIVITCAYIL